MLKTSKNAIKILNEYVYYLHYVRFNLSVLRLSKGNYTYICTYTRISTKSRYTNWQMIFELDLEQQYQYTN